MASKPFKPNGILKNLIGTLIIDCGVRRVCSNKIK